MITLQSLRDASAIVYRHMQPTPAYVWPLLCEAVGAEVWVKHENHTPIGAFKVRGGLVYLHEQYRQGAVGPLVTATRGNHGQSIPYAAQVYGRVVDVFVPEGNSEEKNDAMRAWGAHLHVQGADFDAARQAAVDYAAAHGGHLVPSFHTDLVRGVASYALELFEAVADLDVVYVPIGMGSGAAGVVAVRDALGLSTEVVGVVAQGADAFRQSFDAGRIVNADSARTFADGMATRMPHPDAFAWLRDSLARVVSVSDDEIAAAMRLLYRCTHNVAEGAGAAALAAAVQEQQSGVSTARRKGVILSGGNIDGRLLRQVLAGETPIAA